MLGYSKEYRRLEEPQVQEISISLELKEKLKNGNGEGKVLNLIKNNKSVIKLVIK